MRGDDQLQGGVFSYMLADQRIPEQRAPLRKMVDELESDLSPRGRPSIGPEKLLRALLVQVLYTIRSERQLMEQDYNQQYRWFVGFKIDDPIWM